MVLHCMICCAPFLTRNSVSYTSSKPVCSGEKDSSPSHLLPNNSVTLFCCRILVYSSKGQVLAELRNMDEVVNDPVLHTKCCQLLMFKPVREVFVALQDFEEKRMHFLMHAANNPCHS